MTYRIFKQTNYITHYNGDLSKISCSITPPDYRVFFTHPCYQNREVEVFSTETLEEAQDFIKYHKQYLRNVLLNNTQTPV